MDWSSDAAGGVLRETPLLLSVCMAGAYGECVEYEGGGLYRALFTYLRGEASRGLFEARPELFFGQYLVCMSPDWEDFLRRQPALDRVLRRWLMKPRRGASAKALSALPPGYRLCAFDAEAFREHPYGHGANYRDYGEFARRGAGAVVRYGGRIVASASSYLTFGGDVELDVTTDAGHRQRGLADHCVAAMLDDCAARGLTVHWDAQNDASLNMALGHGFLVQQEYRVFILKV